MKSRREKSMSDTVRLKTWLLNADMLTKGLYAKQFMKLREMAGVKELHQQSDIKWEGV